MPSEVQAIAYTSVFLSRALASYIFKDKVKNSVKKIV
jgi:hypothetical protein